MNGNTGVFTPLKLLIIIAVSIFIAESIIMSSLIVFGDMNHYLVIFIDSFVLIAVVFPVLYFFLFVPLSQMIFQLKVKHLELQENQDHLENQVHIRTRELEKANDGLLKFDKLKDEFLATTSHELRTPLAAILGYAEAIKECKPEQIQQEQFVQNIIDETNRLNDLIENTLDVALLTSGNFTFSFATYDLNEIILKSITLIKGLILESPGLTIDYKLPKNPVNIWGDEQRIIQVAVNLLSNAVKFSPPKGVIRVQVFHLKQSVIVKIKDDGDGISQEHFVSIFHKFNQIRGKGKEIKGTGLGLTISKGIIDAHKGKIWVENHDLGGAVFCFELPC